MLPGILSLFSLIIMLSFVDYASPERITELLIKERVKVAIKGKLHKLSPVLTLNKEENNEKLSIAEQLFLIMPPRDSWCRPQKKDRINSDNEKRSDKQILTRAIAMTIKKHRKSTDSHPYLKRLDAYIASLRNDITSNEPLEFNSIKIFGKKKKVAPDGTIILRPLCVFESLSEKLLIALASKYLSEAFDPLLHEEILSYRPPRIYHNSSELVLTDRDNAIENLLQYRSTHRMHNIYVTECDIQKYFDTINHDVIRECFSAFVAKIKEQHPQFDYTSVGRIVEAYLNSYSFFKTVVAENNRLMRQTPPQLFESPKEELFIERGCYTEEEFLTSKDKIGIPQGGALSGLISNVVLSTVDSKSILKNADPNRFFCRYGDDIMLMHTSKKECQHLIDSYCETLTKHKLLYHEFISVSDPQFRRKNDTVRPSLWNQKSRKPFLWGRNNNDSEQIDWIGFLGYEIRYSGDVRLRRSSLNDKFKAIKRKYHAAVKTKIAKGTLTEATAEKIDQEILNRIEKFKGTNLKSAKSLNANKFSATQEHKLTQYSNKWLFRLLYKIAKRNNLSKQQLNDYWQTAKELN